MFAIRINEHLGYKQTMIELFQRDRFTRSICLPHTGKTGDNPHFHLIVESDYKDDALRKELKKHFTQGKGNKHLSIKVWDGNPKGLSYLFHEGTDPIFVKGYTSDDIMNFRKQDEFIKANIDANQPRKVVEIIVAQCRQKGNCYHKEICMLFFDYYKSKGEWFPNKFQMDRYIKAVQGILADTPVAWDCLKETWYNDMFCRIY